MPDTTSSTSSASWGPSQWVLLLAVLIGGFFYVQGQRIAVQRVSQTSPQITVSGEGKISAPPDIAMLSFGVQTGKKPTAKEAMAALQRGMDAVLTSVRREGIAEKDISTQQFSLQPVYDWSTGRQVILGYEATQTLALKVRDLDQVGDVLSSATNAGANQVGGVSFTIDDPEKQRAEAREEAITQATDKAKVLARQLGLSLGKVVSFSEGGGYNPPMPMYDRAMGAVANEAKSVELPAGEQDVNVTVSITYELQ